LNWRTRRKAIVLILQIDGVLEQESLHVSIWDPLMRNLGAQALFWFPQRFYSSVTPAALDLRQRPDINFCKPMGNEPVGRASRARTLSSPWKFRNPQFSPLMESCTPWIRWIPDSLKLMLSAVNIADQAGYQDHCEAPNAMTCWKPGT